MIALVDSLRAAASSGGLVAVPLALAGGVVAGLNPCCFPLYPAAAATCCAGRRDGVGLPMLVLGIAASSLARRLDRLGWRAWVNRLSGAALIALGFYLLVVA